MAALSHYDKNGRVRMVDVTDKAPSVRIAEAHAFVRMRKSTIASLSKSGAAVAALTIYDMCKALERGIEITEVYLKSKSGGRSGSYARPRKHAKP